MSLAEHSGTIDIADLGTVYRLGFGAMRITGSGIWGEPKDRGEAIAVVRRAVELGVNFIDTADSYGPDVSELILAEALHPYAEGLKIGTKAGFTREGPNRWTTNGRPDYLRERVDGQPEEAAGRASGSAPAAPDRPQGARGRPVRRAR